MMKLRKKNSNIKENENKTESIRLTSQTCGLGHEMRITQQKSNSMLNDS